MKRISRYKGLRKSSNIHLRTNKEIEKEHRGMDKQMIEITKLLNGTYEAVCSRMMSCYEQLHEIILHNALTQFQCVL